MDQPPRSRNPASDPSPDGQVHPTDELTTAQVVRRVRIDAPVDVVWSALTGAAELGRWLDAEVELEAAMAPGVAGRITDADGSVRHLLVTEVDPGRRVGWHWWEDGGELSSVEITATPDGETTEVCVVETVALASVTSGGARASLAIAEVMERRWSAGAANLSARFTARLGVAPMSVLP
jgi:uncharacterized protein YndB with AHSA1/START domain